MDAAANVHRDCVASHPSFRALHLCVHVLVVLLGTSASAEDQAVAAPNTSVSLELPVDPGPPTSDAAEAQTTLPPRSQAVEAGRLPVRNGRSEARLEPTADDTRPWYRSAIGSLVIVLTMIAGAAWVVRRMVPSFRTGETGAMSVLARTAVSQRQAVALIQVGRRVLVVGLSASRVDRLAEIDDPCEVAELVARAGGKAVGPRFNRILEERAEEFAADEDAGEAEAAAQPHSAPVSALLRRLKMLQRSA